MTTKATKGLRDNADRTPPVYAALRDVYDESACAAQRARYARLVAEFRAAFPDVAPAFVVRTPGRVNAIGEHIDYAGFAVLPMAIGRDIAVCVGKRPSAHPTVRARSEGYPAMDFAHADAAGIDCTTHHWGNYVRAGYVGAYTQLALPTPDYDLCLTVHSTLPAGSGLSSSSAMVCAMILAATWAAGCNVPLKRLAQIAIESERLIGVNSGGMDQSISMMATRGAAAVVHFTPKLTLDPVMFPPGFGTWVVAHSLATADKHVTAKRNYNLRVVETRLSAALLGAQLGSGIYADLVRFSDPVVPQLDALAERAETELAGPHGDGQWTLAEVAAAVRVSEQQLHDAYLTAFPVEFEKLKLRDRTRHVLREAARVLRAASPPLDPARFGTLMRESHASCRDLYECSHPDIEALLAAAQRCDGVLGSRLTGAGWGGATIHLVRDDAVDAFINTLAREFYAPRGVQDTQFYLFATRPGAGAGVFVDLDQFVV